MTRSLVTTRCGAPLRRLTKMEAQYGSGGISIIARRRFSPSRGYSISIEEGFTDQEGAVTGYNPKKPEAVLITPIRWLAHGWFSMSMLLQAT